MLKGNNDREWFQKNKARYESGVVARFHRGYGESTAENFNMLPDDREAAEWIADADLQVYSFHEKQDSVQNEHWYPLSARSRLYGTRSWISPSLRARRLLHRSWYLTTRQATVVANRRAISETPADCKKAHNTKRFRSTFERSGDSLKRLPAGFKKDDSIVEDHKRKDLIAVCKIDENKITEPEFLQEVTKNFKGATRLMRSLCHPLESQGQLAYWGSKESWMLTL